MQFQPFRNSGPLKKKTKAVDTETQDRSSVSGTGGPGGGSAPRLAAERLVPHLLRRPLGQSDRIGNRARYEMSLALCDAQQVAAALYPHQ